MSISDRDYDSRLSFGTTVNPLVVLIAISMILFVILAFFKAIIYVFMPEGGAVAENFNRNVLSWFALSSDPGKAIARPWTFLTYSLVHLQIWPLFANMLWLWSFGYIFIDLTGNRKLIPMFIYGTLAGAAAFLVVARFTSVGQDTSGLFHYFGSAPAILAIAIAATTISPGYKVLPVLGGGFSLWILTVIFLVVDLAGLSPGNAPILVSHIVGALSGFLFIMILRRGYDGSEWMNALYDWFTNLFNPDKTRSKTVWGGSSSLFYHTPGLPYRKSTRVTQQKLDELLDKINQSGGYDNLSSEEKDMLERASREEDLEK